MLSRRMWLFLALCSVSALSASAGFLDRPNRWDQTFNAKGLRYNKHAHSFPSVSEPSWSYLTVWITPSPLTAEERFKILGIPTHLSEKKLEELIEERKLGDSMRRLKGNGGLDCIDRMLYRALHYVLGLEFSAEDSKRWKSLAEKRYSYLRELITEIKELPGVKWGAEDYRLRDGTYVFVGNQLAVTLFIRASDGAIFTGRSQSAWVKGRQWKPDFENIRLIRRELLFCSYFLKP